jgi:hypothetical protein
MSSKEKGRPSRIDESVGEWRITGGVDRVAVGERG